MSKLPPGMMTLGQACRWLDLTARELDHLLATGQIPYHQIGTRTFIEISVIADLWIRRPQARKAAVTEQRRRELATQAAMMTASELRPADKQVRHRTGADDHLELGVPKIPRTYKDPRRKAPDAIPAGPEPEVPQDFLPVPCANETCGTLFRKPQWAVREPRPGELYCSKECGTEQKRRDRERERKQEKALRRVAAHKGEEYRPLPSPLSMDFPAT
jgi:hypothetical protein